MAKRKQKDLLLLGLIRLAAAVTVLLLAGILGFVLVQGLPHLSWGFLTGVPSVIRKVEGILPYLVNTVLVVALTVAAALPVGVGAAVYLNEYARSRRLIALIEFTAEVLAGIPSIIYGLAGMLIFGQKLGLGSSLLSGSFTLAVLILPTVIRTTQESLRTVPQTYREGALGLGAGRWHIVRTVVLPSCMDGILAGAILAVGRIVGESAALLFTAGCAKTMARSLAAAYTGSGATLSVALYMTVFEEGKFETGYATAAVLMAVVLGLNLLARLASKAFKRNI